MKRTAFILIAAFGMMTLASPVFAEDKKADTKKQVNIPKCDFSKEFKALEEGAAMLAEVKDAAAAKKVSKKLCAMFNMLPVPMGGNEEELEVWAKKANLLNMQMERLRKEKWFVSSGLQEAWTIATDPFSRRRAAKK